MSFVVFLVNSLIFATFFFSVFLFVFSSVCIRAGILGFFNENSESYNGFPLYIHTFASLDKL